jgi:hypothetical protein
MQIAMTVAARQLEIAAVELSHHLGDTAHLQEGLEQQREPFLHLQVRVLHDDAGGIANETDGQRERQLCALCFCQKACCQPAADRVQFQLGYRSFSGRAAIGRSRCRDRRRHHDRR